MKFRGTYLRVPIIRSTVLILECPYWGPSNFGKHSFLHASGIFVSLEGRRLGSRKEGGKRKEAICKLAARTVPFTFRVEGLFVFLVRPCSESVLGEF